MEGTIVSALTKYSVEVGMLILETIAIAIMARVFYQLINRVTDYIRDNTVAVAALKEQINGLGERVSGVEREMIDNRRSRK